jgi:hypothetical protein
MTTKRRHCGFCNQSGHNRRACPLDRATKPPHRSAGAAAMAPDVAMHTMLDVNYAIYLVTEGRVGEALSNATRAIAEVREAGLVSSDTMIIALAELELRAREIAPIETVILKDLRQKRDEAAAAYNVEMTAIAKRLGFKP